MAVYEYAAMAVKVAAFSRLREENKAIKVENQKYQILSSHLAEKIASLEITSMKVSVLSGLESPDPKSGIGGVGGLTRGITSSLPNKLNAYDLQAYQKTVSALETRYRDLQSYFDDKAIRIAFTPNIWPVKGYLTGGFGYRNDPLGGAGREYHYGIDISTPYGNKIIAPADGVVIFAGPREDYGNMVVIDHKFGTTTRYGHLSRSAVRVGQKISRGDIIGYIGLTGRTSGPHLHYEVRIHDRAVNPVPFLKNYLKIG
jgi:murein DD-endopeptidase MepM/ murein hydrolase activator NlpD